LLRHQCAGSVVTWEGSRDHPRLSLEPLLTRHTLRHVRAISWDPRAVQESYAAAARDFADPDVRADYERLSRSERIQYFGMLLTVESGDARLAGEAFGVSLPTDVSYSGRGTVLRRGDWLLPVGK